MATEAQIQANRLNSVKSTGPKTEAGKEKSRANAVRHGLSGEGIALSEEMKRAVDQRMTEWLPEFQPQSSHQHWLVKRICVESVLIDSCEYRESNIRRELSLRAQESWNDDRTLDARKLFDKLAKKPEIIQGQLLQTKQGCQTLIEHWQTLGRMIQVQEGWTPKEWSQALDLLGIPIEGRETLVPTAKENLDWIIQQIQKLQTLQAEVLDARDERERLQTAAQQPFHEPTEIKNHRRYEAACLRRLRWALDELKAAQKATQPKSKPEPKPSQEFEKTTKPHLAQKPASPSPTEHRRPPAPARLSRQARKAAQARARAEAKARAKQENLLV